MRIAVLVFALLAANLAANQALAQFWVGDRELQTQEENSWYRVSFDELWNLFQAQGRGAEILGLPIDHLALLSSPVDSLPLWPSGPISPSRLQSIALQVIDHSESGLGPGNQTFDSGDTLVFYGQGTSRWRGLGKTHAQYNFMPYVFEQSIYGFERSYILYDWKEKALRPWRLALDPVDNPEIEGLGLRRYEKDSLLLDRYFGADDPESGREYFWHWGLGPGQMSNSFYFESEHPYGGRLDSITRSYGWAQLAFFPARHHYIVGISDQLLYNTDGSRLRIDTLPVLKRFQGINPKFITNGSFWETNLGQVQWTEYGALGLSTTLLDTNHFILSMDQKTEELRFDGLSLAWFKHWHLDSLGREQLWPFQGAGLRHFKIPASTGSALRLDGGEWLGAMPQLYNSQLSDTSAEDRHWELLGSQSLKPRISLVPVQNRSMAAVLKLEQMPLRADLRMVILCPSAFGTQCESWKDYRQSPEGGSVSTEVIHTEDLYAVYSSGQASPQALRDFLRSAKKSWAPNLEAVLLMGDGRLDQRKVLYASQGDFVPIYTEMDMSSDDYFAVLDSGACLSYRGPQCGHYQLDLALGRLPVTQSSQIMPILEKVKAYESKRIGPGQNTLTLSADDYFQGESPDAIPHMGASERLSRKVSLLAPNLGQEKIYLQDEAANLQGLKPLSHSALMKALGEGRMAVNFFGHGSPGSISGEGLLDQANLLQLGQDAACSVFSSFSCLVGRFDSPSRESLAETMLLQKGRGVVAALTGMRDSWADRNEVLAQDFYAELLTGARTFGEALRRAKNAHRDLGQKYNDERYALLGDPMLRLPLWDQQLQVDTIVDTVMALQHWKMNISAPSMAQGQVLLVLEGPTQTKSWSQSFKSSFAGAADLVLKDTAQFAGITLLKLQSEIKQGQASFDFYTPRQVASQMGLGKLWLLAWDSTKGLRSMYAQNALPVSGKTMDLSSLNDTIAPQIIAFPCGQSNKQLFASDIQLRAPACLEFQVKDNFALDFSLETDQGTVYRYEGEEEIHRPQWMSTSPSEGHFRIRIDSAWSGSRELQLYSRDLIGNQSQKTWKIQMLDPGASPLIDVYNQPNPMQERTAFQFKILDPNIGSVNVRIFDQSGHLVRILSKIQPGTQWDGRDDWGNLLANGLYFYKLYAQRPGSNGIETISKLQRLVISR